MSQVVVIEPFVSVGPVHFGMDYEAASAALGGLAPTFTPGQGRYVQAGTLIVVEFDDDGLVEGVSMAPDRKHGGVVAELDGLLLAAADVDPLVGQVHHRPRPAGHGGMFGNIRKPRSVSFVSSLVNLPLIERIDQVIEEFGGLGKPDKL